MEEFVYLMDKLLDFVIYYFIFLFKFEEVELRLFCVYLVGRYVMNFVFFVNGFI